jgi:hypothetical protein
MFRTPSFIRVYAIQAAPATPPTRVNAIAAAM